MLYLLFYFSSCQTVLANEQAAGDHCWRCDSEVTQKEMEQWFLKITDYAEELLSGHDLLEKWPEHVLLMQKNWIGKSSGAQLTFPVSGRDLVIDVFTTHNPGDRHGMTSDLSKNEIEDLAEFVLARSSWRLLPGRGSSSTAGIGPKGTITASG